MKTLIFNYDSPAIPMLIKKLSYLDPDFEQYKDKEPPQWFIDVAAFLIGMAPLLQHLSTDSELPAITRTVIELAKKNPGELYVFTAAASRLEAIVQKQSEEQLK